MLSRSVHAGEDALCRLLTSRSVASSRFLDPLIEGKLNDTRSRAFLALLANRGESPSELLEAWKSIRRAESITVPKISGAIDTCGTGGDGSSSINLSTLSSFVIAAAGMPVIKHGNRAITSKCGSSDLLAAFGMNLNQSATRTVLSARKMGMGYFHAPHIHPVYRQFQTIRRTLRIRTLFNLLGPVLNPAVVDYQLLGVSDPQLLAIYSDLLPRMGRKSAFIYIGANHTDEITTLGPSAGLFLKTNHISEWTVLPQTLGFKKGRIGELRIRSISEAKQKTIRILKNKVNDSARDSVILSAACGLYLDGSHASLMGAVHAARHALISGKAWNVLVNMVRFSKL